MQFLASDSTGKEILQDWWWKKRLPSNLKGLARHLPDKAGQNFGEDKAWVLPAFVIIPSPAPEVCESW